MKILVILHIYYEEFADYYIDKLGNINGCGWDLVVTGHNLSSALKEKILGRKADARFIQTPNIGYDVWPFICAVRSVNLDEYSFILKLHTKNQDNLTVRFNGIQFDGEKWRSELVDALLRSPSRFRKVRDIFASRPDVGIVYSACLNIPLGWRLREDTVDLKNEMARLGISPSVTSYCGGTMFAARAEALKWLNDERVSEDIFQAPTGSHAGGTLAHVYERLICIAIASDGYSAVLLAGSARLGIRRWVSASLKWLFTIDHKSPDGVKCLTVFGRDFPLERRNGSAPGRGEKSAE